MTYRYNNYKNLVSGLIAFLLFWQCSQSGNHQVKSNERIQKTEICEADENHSYEIYFPANAMECGQLPLLLIIDPQGRGKPALDKFISVADKYKIALVSSNLIRNNFSGFPAAINLLLEDIRNKYGINEELYLAGFSGGARMAITYAQYYAVEGLFVCGALATPEQLASTKSLVFALSGLSDFNFIEAAQYLFRPDQAPENLRIEFIDNTHQWPDQEHIEKALGYILLNKINPEVQCIDLKQLKSSYLTDQIKRLQKLVDKHDYISAYLLSQNLAYSDIFYSDPGLLEAFDNLNYDDGLTSQMNQLKESIRFELKNRENYYKTLFSKNANWWKKEIKSLNTHIEEKRNKFNSLAYTRIKAFLGITCYSLSNNALQSNDIKSAEQILPIYAIVEPNNPDMLYFKALCSSKKGNTDEASHFLKQALNAGFNDNRLIQQLEESLH